MPRKIAKTTFAAGVDQGTVIVHQGESFDAADMVVVGYPDAFLTPDEFAAYNESRPVSHTAPTENPKPRKK